eukprot:CAMPEP_0197241516 /NCGR_PEP_ID=MMETSP1429-20130617/7522_1 /TAXON_ID=49237 /ORGANISM="Chaetoceros  sp., Strain UNC1202" /LENGTH=155 /DNA_ID=CAMNT_0042701361 /DNA_START=106 /DNA_END=573 /DNA_ORIENTATION=-
MSQIPVLNYIVEPFEGEAIIVNASSNKIVRPDKNAETGTLTSLDFSDATRFNPYGESPMKVTPSPIMPSQGLGESSIELTNQASLWLGLCGAVLAAQSMISPRAGRSAAVVPYMMMNGRSSSGVKSMRYMKGLSAPMYALAACGCLASSLRCSRP